MPPFKHTQITITQELEQSWIDFPEIADVPSVVRKTPSIVAFGPFFRKWHFVSSVFAWIVFSTLPLVFFAHYNVGYPFSLHIFFNVALTHFWPVAFYAIILMQFPRMRFFALRHTAYYVIVACFLPILLYLLCLRTWYSPLSQLPLEDRDRNLLNEYYLLAERLYVYEPLPLPQNGSEVHALGRAYAPLILEKIATEKKNQ